MGHERVARVVLGLAAALALAVLAAHPRVKAIERRLGVSVLLSTGLPFLALGLLFRLDRVGVLTPDTLVDLKPVFEFGLGWIGFVVGMRFDVRRLRVIPRRLGAVVGLATLIPIAATGALCTAAFFAVDLRSVWSRGFLRDALVLAACAAPSGNAAIDRVVSRLGVRAARFIEGLAVIDDVAAFALLGWLACSFRPETIGARWALPTGAWVLVLLGLGGVLGLLGYLLIRGATNASEELALLLGTVALSAGIAGYLGLPPPVVCALAGALLANLPLRDAEGFRRVLNDVERPLYLGFLLVVGAAWRPGEWQGWVLAPMFVTARVAGKYLVAILSRALGQRDLPPARELALSLLPQSTTSIVVIVSAATLWADGGGSRIRWGINAVIVGGVLAEVAMRALQRGAPPAAAPAASDAIPATIAADPTAPATAESGGEAP